jgi:hypothetical protein
MSPLQPGALTTGRGRTRARLPAGPGALRPAAPAATLAPLAPAARPARCRIRHTIVLEDPFDDPPQLAQLIPDASPAPVFEQGERLEDDWVRRAGRAPAPDAACPRPAVVCRCARHAPGRRGGG